MKSYVTVEELNAATVLLTGIPGSELYEVHIAGSIVTVLSADENGELVAKRLMIGEPPKPEAEDVEEAEVIEDDGT